MSKDDKKTDWPIHPRWLSIKNNVQGKDLKPNSQGIYSPDTLRGFIADMSAHKEIKNALSIFQVVPKTYKYVNSKGSNQQIKKIQTDDAYIKGILTTQGQNNDEEGVIIQIDSGGLHPNFEPCEAFRKHKNKGRKPNECGKECQALDCRIAILYHPDLRGHHFFKDNKKYIEKLKEIIVDYNKSPLGSDSPIELAGFFTNKEKKIKTEVKGEIKDIPYKYEKPYLKYRCVYSNLDEYFYPVIHSGEIIAVVMQGQRPHNKLKEEGLFPNCKDSKVKESVAAVHNNFFTQAGHDDKRANMIYERIKVLEDRIDDRIAAKVQRYVLDKFAEFEKGFRTEVEKLRDSDNFQKEFLKILDKTLKKISKAFDKKLVCIYVRDFDLDNWATKTETIKFKLVGKAIKAGSQKKYYKELTFEKELLSNNNITNELKGEEHKTLLKFFMSGDRAQIKENDTFRYAPQFDTRAGYIIWKRYPKWKKAYSEQYKQYADSLIAMYPTLLEPYFIMRSLELEKMLAGSMRIIVHESAQIFPLVINSVKKGNIKYFIENPGSTLTTSKVSFPSNTIIDLIQRLTLLERLFRNSTMMLKDISPVLNWKHIHQITSDTSSSFTKKAKEEDRHLKTELGLSKSSQLHTDYELMTLILFNLMDNAIKYGVKGSNIFLKIKKADNGEEKVIQLSVISFGKEIKKKDREKIFELGHRTETAKETAKKETAGMGMGMGLFLVQKLCNVLGYKIKCGSKRVLEEDVKINIPYYYHYKKNKPDYKNEELSETTVKLLETPISSDKIDKVVCQEIVGWSISYMELESKIREEVYENEFVITIPINARNFKTI